MIVTETRREADHGRHLREIFMVLRRRRRWIAACTVAAAALAAGHLALRTTRYTAEAVLALDARKVQVLPLDSVVSRLPQESPVLRTELDVIASRGMAVQVLGRLGAATSAAPAAGVDDRRDAVDELLGGLRVSNDGRSFTIVVAFTDADPARAALVANAFAEGYLEQITSAQTTATRDAGEWLGRRLDALRRRLETSENTVQAFRRSAGLIEAGGTTLQEQRLNALTAELASARSARAAAEARLSAADDLAKTERGEGADAFDSPAVQILRRDLGQAERMLYEIEQGGALKSPEIPALRTRIASIRKQIASETERLRGNLANEVEIARRKERDVAAAATDAEAALQRVRAAGVQLDQLEREARADRTLYESFLNRYKQTVEQEGLAAPEARIISRAEPPRLPSSRRMPVIILALLGGFGAGMGLAFLVDRLDRRIRSVRRMEAETGISVLGELPQPRRKAAVLQLLPVTEPMSPYAEAMRRLCSVLDLPRETDVGRVLVVTSAERQDGKTALVVSLARTLAAGGRKVVAVEAHAAGAQLGAAFGCVPTADLGAIARNRYVADDLIEPDPQSEAFVVAAGPGGRVPAVYVDTEGFARLIATLKLRFDVVILDAPSAESGGEAVPAARMGDIVLLAARWKRTTADAVAAAVRRLALGGVQPAGFVLTGCDGDLDLSQAPAPLRPTSAAPESPARAVSPVRRRPTTLVIPGMPVAARGPFAETSE